MIELLLVRIRLCVRLAYALRDDLGKTLLMTGVFAVCTLHTGRILEKVAA